MNMLTGKKKIEKRAGRRRLRRRMKNKLKAKKVEKNTRKQQYIPHCILHDMLLKLPVKSLMRFKAVHTSWNSRFQVLSYKTIHTSWNSMVSSPKFSLSHLRQSRAQHSPRRYGVIQVENTHCSSPSLSLYSTMINVAKHPDIEKIEMENPFGEIYLSTNTDAQVYGSCNGIGYDASSKNYKVVTIHGPNSDYSVIRNYYIGIYNHKESNWAKK
ncbi:conserved hypothetical protein [Ricinus communis]|uniref:Uncharacterized protein n=1 Tax=Ricinus communis TaxID=3988 RepID=B9RSS5_RICCO|nr:conserved hypothetical protein [Ricinus communis]